MPYGSCPGSGGKVVLQIHLDARIIPVGSANIGITAVPYTITYDPNVRDSMYIQLHEIPPGETVNVQITVQMESRAELFDRCYWQADLYLRDKLIEYNFEKIRVTPFYIPREPTADILMVTNEVITRKEFVFWQRILEILEVTVDFWDTTRYNGLSVDRQTNTRHQKSWEGRYPGKMILYPHCDLQLFWGVDIVRHFHGAQHRDSPLSDVHSSMVLLFPPSPPHQRQADQFHDCGDLALLRHLASVDATLEVAEEDYGGKHLFQPGSCFVTPKPYLGWEKKHLKKLEKEIPNQAPTVLQRTVNIQRGTGFLKYNYGRVDVRRIPLLRSCKFTSYDGAGGDIAAMSLDDSNLTPASSTIPLASNYGQVFLVTLYGIPMSCKLNLLKTKPDEAVQAQHPVIVFTLPSDYTLSMAELILITIAWEVADEIYSCSGTAERMTEFANDVQNSTAAYVANGRAVARGLKLIEDEVKVRNKKMSNALVSAAISEIKRHVSHTKQALRRAGVDCNNAEDLPRLISLLDHSRVHRSHQHWIKDSRWNLPAF